jgi:Protein of unknown function (DUF3455)
VPQACPFHFLKEKIMKTITTLAAMCVALGLGACASSPSSSIATSSKASTAKSTELPDAIATPADQKPAFTWHAVGVQIYECKLSDKGAPAWAFVAPEADLTNDKDQKVGTHGAGPFWMANDGSKIVGAVKGRSPAANVQDIPWLLLTVQSSSGNGKMSSIKSVQRINTEGGQPPATGCSTQADLGKRNQQGYSSDYVFLTAR